MEMPPVIQIALEEGFGKVRSTYELRNLLTTQGIEKELTAQAEWTTDEFKYLDSKENAELRQVTVAPSGTLNPFSPVGKCRSESCISRATDDFIKTVGLYSEVAVIPDPITTYFVGDHKDKDSFYDALLRDFRMVEQLRPLIESNVLVFGNPIRHFCAHCNDEMEKHLREATEFLLSASQNSKVDLVKLKNGDYLLGIQIPILSPEHDHPLTNFTHLTKTEAARLRLANSSVKQKRTKKVINEVLSRVFRRDAKTTFFEMDLSRRLGSLLLAGSRGETLLISALNQGAPRPTEIEDWEKMRTVHLPWIDHLTAEEVLILRNEASKALPKLRELLRTTLTKPSTGDPLVALDDLRMQALEVKAELDSLNLPKERKYRTGLGALAMSFVVYGFASQSPPLVATSIGALLATLAHLRNAERELETKVSKLVSMPAYALLKAREIITHR